MLNDRARHSLSGKGVSPLKIRVGCAAFFQRPSPYFRPKQESISWNLSCVVHVQKENKTNKANVTCWNVKIPFQGLTFGRLVWILRDGPESAPKSTLIRTNCFATKTPWNKYMGIARYELWAPTKISLLHFSPQSVTQSTLFYSSLNFRHCFESLTPSVKSESWRHYSLALIHAKSKTRFSTGKQRNIVRKCLHGTEPLYTFW